MNERITQLLAQIAALEGDLRDALHEQESKALFQIKGRRVEFESTVKAAHRRLQKNVFVWLVTNRPRNLITAPIIYGMIFPLLLMDVLVTFYQWTCFPVYGVKKVRRADYIVFDRHQLDYLNFIEKFHCSYCEYGNGLMSYMTEILARTEEYFCPIKHARKVLGSHARYQRFLTYGDAVDYHARLEKFRTGLGQADQAGAGFQHHQHP